jgi:DNA polymerase-3 subunit delta'
MSLDIVIGQPFAVDLCRRWLKQNTTHPLLMYGPEGVGKKLVALQVAEALNCAKEASPGFRPPSPQLRGAGGEACDVCPSCRKIATGHHPDVRVIDLTWQALERKEPLEKQQNLRIETILTERHRLLQSPVEGTWKVLILDDAHRLTPDAANVLLKILEEPPSHTAVFLLTPFRDRLLTTLISRCQPIRFRWLSDAEMIHCLNRLNIPTASQPRLTEMALGSPGRALHLSREEQIESIQEAERIWQALARPVSARALHDAGNRKSAKPNRMDIEERIHGLLIPATRDLRAGDARARQSVQLLQNAAAQLRQNVQPALVYDNLLLQLARVPHG